MSENKNLETLAFFIRIIALGLSLGSVYSALTGKIDSAIWNMLSAIFAPMLVPLLTICFNMSLSPSRFSDRYLYIFVILSANLSVLLMIMLLCGSVISHFSFRAQPVISYSSLLISHLELIEVHCLDLFLIVLIQHATADFQRVRQLALLH